MKFDHHWRRGFRGESFEIINSFSKQMHTEANLISPQKGQTTISTIILATLVDLPSPIICAKIQPEGILCSGEEDF